MWGRSSLEELAHLASLIARTEGIETTSPRYGRWQDAPSRASSPAPRALKPGHDHVVNIPQVLASLIARTEGIETPRRLGSTSPLTTSRASSPAPRALKLADDQLIAHVLVFSRASSPAPRALKRRGVELCDLSKLHSRASSPAPRALKHDYRRNQALDELLASLIARTEGIETRSPPTAGIPQPPREPHRP